MRTSGLLLTVLVVAGGAWAQYPGGGGQQQIEEYFVCAQNEACVFWQQCHDGVLNTGGIGIINIRTPPPIPSNITDARPCEEVGKLCCVDPDKPGVDPGLNDYCPLHHLCVPKAQCYNGEINTSGADLIDIRVRGTPCTNPEYPGVDAVCCKRPSSIPLPLETCASTYETCRYAQDCEASSGTYDASVECYVDAQAGLTGVCCSPPVVPQCSSNRVCVTNAQCTAQGYVNTDGAGNFDVRILDRCDLGGGATGVCCLGPPVEKCSEPKTVCVEPGFCEASHLSAPNGYTETCYRTEGSGAVGECCVEQPVLTCPADYTCNLPDQCVEEEAAIIHNPSCALNSELVGVCCTKKPPPVQIVDVCPQDSVCLPELLCSVSAGSTACRISGTGYSNPGVCCTDAYPEPEPPTPNVECGVGSPDIDTRIQSSKLLKKQARFAEFPWMGIIFFTNYTYKCGASLVDESWVLTAAHCVAGFGVNDFRVRLGEYQVDLYDTLYPYEDYDVASITIHPSFNPKNLHNDVAVLKLSTPVTYRHHINRICLPPPDRVHTAGQECVATGWGKDAFDGGQFQATLKKVILPVVPPGQCQSQLRRTRLGDFFILDKSFVCAGGEADQDACTGDGGGPLACLNPNNGRYELYGMTAWGIGCGIQGNPGVYVNVPHFMDWVYEIIALTPVQIEQHSVGSYGK